jgi:microcystin-dependent protein
MANDFEWKLKVSSLLDGIKRTLTNHASAIADVDDKIAEAVRKRDESFKKKIGFVEVTACENIPEDYLLCNGAELSREEYSELFAAIGTKYGEGDGETTFNVPNLDGKFIEGAGAVELGTSINAGVPNVTGAISQHKGSEGNSASGAFTVNQSAVDTSGHTGSTFYCDSTFTLDASRSSDVYGASTTVQPPAVALCYVIKYQ